GPAGLSRGKGRSWPEGRTTPRSSGRRPPTGAATTPWSPAGGGPSGAPAGAPGARAANQPPPAAAPPQKGQDRGPSPLPPGGGTPAALPLIVPSGEDDRPGRQATSPRRSSPAAPRGPPAFSAKAPGTARPRVEPPRAPASPLTGRRTPWCQPSSGARMLALTT